MRIALMIEGQEDVTWDDWVALAETCERSGIEALFRSDHYLSVFGQNERGALDAWGTICALAARTSTLQLGTLVSPASFRHPSILAKLAVTADHVSGGRVSLGLGTGWSEVEHTAYGFPFLGMKERMDVLEEQLEIVRGMLFPTPFHHGPFSFSGEHYTLADLDAHPKPLGKLPLIMGGSAGPRAARLAATYADEYNTVNPSVEEVRERRAAIAAACERAGRAPIPFSVMFAFGDDVVERLREFEAAGASRAYLQHLQHRDLERVGWIGREVVPAVA
jgi:alkanesulfonate monooxygenase SsuD/methylene tetrahydromethanopterin reductase-like flavin-dependent oxidoreductase (luciferase family)